jgi:dATP pyrophosphohydrolase
MLRPMAFKLPESVLVVVYTAALDVLLLERAKNPGFWQSVTGSPTATRSGRNGVPATRPT